MSFAIEVPGEAIPLTPQDLCRALQAATCSDFAQRQSAGQQLAAWETHGDYFPGLQAVFLDKSLPRELRLLAVIQLKNGIDKYWRAAAKNGIRPEQKNIIRSRIFQGSIDEEEKSLALQNALAAAKIVRIDFPQEWPDAITSLIDVLRNAKNGNQLHLHGALLVLLRIVKELGTARLRRSQTALQSISAELAFVVGEIYTERTRMWLQFLTGGQGNEDDADLAMQNSLIALKLLRRLLVMGFDYPHRDTFPQEFWSLSQNQFGQLLGFVSHDSIVPTPYQDLVGRHLLQFTKLHLDMCETHPASFALLPNSIQLTLAYWDLVAKFSEVFHKSEGIRANSDSSAQESKSKVEGPLLERLALKGLLLLRSILRMVHYPQQTFKYLNEQSRTEKTNAIEAMKQNLLKSDFVGQVTNVLISNLFIFRQSDLEAWEEDPQEWELREHLEGSAWEWEVRPAAERLFLDLLTNYKELLVDPLLQYFATAMQPDSDVVTKEKVYASLGLAAAHLGEAFNFDGLLSSVLAADAQKQGPGYKILRRRIAMTVRQWVPIQLSDENKRLVYEMFRHFLNPDDPTNDIVVQLTAARELKGVVDAFGFDIEKFQPFAVDIISRLVALVGEVETDETKLALLATLREIVDRMEFHVAQFADLVFSALPAIWDTAGSEEYMIKQSIMVTLSSLVMSLKSASPRYYSLVLPVLAQAIQPGSDLYIYLIEESLELWEAIQSQCTRPLDEGVASLSEMAVTLLDNQTEHALKCCHIVKNYTVLAPEVMLSDKLRAATLHALSTSAEGRSRDLIQTATEALTFLIRAAHELGGTNGLSLVVQDLLSSGFIARIMGQIHEAWEASQTTGPNKKSSKLSVLTEIDYFIILGRILLCDPNMFIQMITQLGELQVVWSWLIPRWFSQYNAMGNGFHSKASCLALTRLIELPSPVQDLVLSQLQDYFTMWTSMVTDCRLEATDGKDAYVWADDEQPYDWETPKDTLERLTTGKDEAHSIITWDWITARLQDLVGRLGGEQQFQDNWVVNIDKDVVVAFQKLSESSE